MCTRKAITCLCKSQNNPSNFRAYQISKAPLLDQNKGINNSQIDVIFTQITFSVGFRRYSLYCIDSLDESQDVVGVANLWRFEKRTSVTGHCEDFVGYGFVFKTTMLCCQPVLTEMASACSDLLWVRNVSKIKLFIVKKMPGQYFICQR